MDEIIEEITTLTNEWYELIGPSHHKDKDCHWYINTKWSYGYAPTYIVEHYGYILSDIEIECSTYKEALEVIKQQLEIAIEREKEFKKLTKDNDEDW
jgi:hypothetical protein